MSEKYAFWVTLRPQSDRYRRGEAEVRTLNFKTTWSEFQRPSQTSAERGNAELRILNFKTTWSEFQKPSQTAAERGNAKLRILDFKTTWSEFQRPSQTAAERGNAELHLNNYFNFQVRLSFRPSSVFHPPSSVLRLPSSVRPKFFFNFCRVSSYSEFQMPGQTAAERGVAELRILSFKTTWSEFH